MSSIDKKTRKDLKLSEKYFNLEILPIARSIGDPEYWFPSGQDENKETYWQKPSRHSLFDVLEIPIEDLQESLKVLWKDDVEIQQLASSLPLLAEKLKRKQILDEISSFIYAMF